MATITLDAIQFFNPSPQHSLSSVERTTSSYSNNPSTTPPRQKGGGRDLKPHGETKSTAGIADHFPTIGELVAAYLGRSKETPIVLNDQIDCGLDKANSSSSNVNSACQGVGLWTPPANPKDHLKGDRVSEIYKLPIMTTISPSIDPRLLAASCHQEGGRICKPVSATAVDREVGFGSDRQLDPDQDAVSKDGFLALEEPRNPTTRKEDLIEEYKDREDALQGAGQQAKPRIVNMGNSQETLVLVDEEGSGDIEATVPACPYDPSSLYPYGPLDDLIGPSDNRHVSREQQQHQDVREEEKQVGSSIDGAGGHDGYDNDHVNNDNVGLQPTKRRRPSSSYSDPISNYSCKRRLHQPLDDRLNISSMLHRSQSAPVQTQDQWPSPLRYDDHGQPQRSSTHSSLGDEEVTSLTCAEYEEWPVRGFFKRTVIGNKTSYSLDFSLEQLQELCASVLPLPTFGPDSERYHFAKYNSSSTARPPAASPPSASIQAKRPRLAPSSQRNRPQFTPEEDKTLIDLREKGFTWKQIKPNFPRRSIGSLQVHYSTKLKGKAISVQVTNGHKHK